MRPDAPAASSSPPSPVIARSAAADSATRGNTLTPDVLVIGGGLVGLAIAAAAADRGLDVVLLVDPRRGEGSPAAAGMLAPSVERDITSAVHAFAVAARDRFPSYVAELRERTGLDVPLDRGGVLQLALSESESDSLRAEAIGGAFGATIPAWLDAATLAATEPALAHAAGALHHLHDGAVNTLVLLRAVKQVVGLHPRVRVFDDPALRVRFDAAGAPTVETRAERRIAAGAVVLAAGAWSGVLDGLPSRVAVEPVRGQIMSVASRALGHVVHSVHGYAVPRYDGRTLIGATVERVGFDADTTEAGVAAVREIGARISPALAHAKMLHAWAGLRPTTPDGLPLLGRDGLQPRLVYACGHSRNGVLMAPLTGDCIAALLAGEEPAADLAPFSPTRFA